MTDTASLWAERVEEWRRSGKSGPAFVAGRGFAVSALKYWAKKLETKPTRPVALARVVRPAAIIEAPVAEPSTEVAEASVEVVVGKARIVVRRGFDAALVRELVTALGGGS